MTAGIVGAIVGALVVALGGVIVALINRRASPYDALAGRVVTLEGRVSGLESELAKRNRLLRRAVDYITHLLGWIALHAPDATPRPDPLPDDLTDI